MLKLRLLSIMSAGLLSVSTLGTLAHAAELNVSDAQGTELARHGADDPAGDDRGHDVARHGADDPAGDDRGRDGGRHA